jgi:hypothetical protein
LGQYFARRANTGARSRKDGQSRYYVGYKKHTLRLWLRQHSSSILLAPLISWAAPANRDDCVFLEPSIHYCAQQLEWTPDIVVGDMSYVGLHRQRRLRENMHVALVTKLKPDMILPEEFEDTFTMTCEQGQILQWFELRETEQLHWFGVTDPNPLCTWCWQQSSCPRQFSYRPSDHEIMFGTIPLSSRVAQQLLRQARSWIEATQSYDKNQLGLSQLFLNSLRLTWTMCLLADTIALLRARVLTTSPEPAELLHQLMPRQMHLNLTPT